VIKNLMILFVFTTSTLGAWDASLDTAREVDYLNDWEKDVIFEMNKVRHDPKRYAQEVLKPLVAYYRGSILNWPGQVPLQTQEGVRALNELIRELERLPGGLPLLNPSQGMSLGAKDHARDQSRTGQVGHYGSDRSDPFKRLNRYGSWLGTAGENIEYGSANGQQSVIFLLIDDGVRDRGHRKNILNARFLVAGVATASHPVYRTVTVTTFAQGFQDSQR